MEHLREIGIVVYIQVDYETIVDRLGNIKQRGVVFRKGQTLLSLYEERCLLYEKYAGITVDSEDLDMESLMEKIAMAVVEYDKQNGK
jgi:shikimate kinase